MSQQPYVPNVAEEFGFNHEEVAFVSANASHTLVNLSKTETWAYDFIEAAASNGYVNKTWDRIVELTCGFMYLNGEGFERKIVDYYAGVVIRGLAADELIENLERTRRWNELEYHVQDKLNAISEEFNTLRQGLNNLFQQTQRRSNINNRGRGMDTRGYSQPRGLDSLGSRSTVGPKSYSRGGSHGFNSNATSPGLTLGGAAARRDNPRGFSRGGREPARERFNDIDTTIVDNAPTYQPAYRQDHNTENNQMRTYRSDATVEGIKSRRERHIATIEEDVGSIAPAPAEVVDETRAQGKELRHVADGKSVLIIRPIDAEEDEDKYPNLFNPQFAPITAGDVQVFYLLDKNRNIVDMIISEEDEMVKEEHETARFFAAWGNKTGLPDVEETSKTLAKLQTNARVDEIEKQLVSRYGLDTDDAELPEKLVDISKLHIVDSDNIAQIKSLDDDLVSIGRSVLFESIDNEKLKSSYMLSNIGGVVIPTNFQTAIVPDWTLNGEAGTLALELIGLKTHGSIRRKLFELADIVDSNIMKLIDKIATDWMNEFIHKQLGYDYGVALSYMADVEQFIDWVEKDDNTLYTAFCSSASLLVNTVLKPLDTNLQEVKDRFDLEGDAWDNQVIFADISNITLINIDSDDFSANLNTNKGIGTITRKTWASMWLVCKNLFGLCTPDVNKVLIVTRDNCKMQISRTYLPGEYSLSQVK